MSVHCKTRVWTYRHGSSRGGNAALAAICQMQQMKGLHFTGTGVGMSIFESLQRQVWAVKQSGVRHSDGSPGAGSYYHPEMLFQCALW